MLVLVSAVIVGLTILHATREWHLVQVRLENLELHLEQHNQTNF